MNEPIDEKRKTDPLLDFLLSWRDGEEIRPLTSFEILDEIAIQVAQDHKCRVTISIVEPDSPGGAATEFSIAPATVARLIQERLQERDARGA